MTTQHNGQTLKLDADEKQYLIELLNKPQKGKCYLCRTSILYKLTGSYN